MAEWGERIRKIRQKAGLAQKDFAQKLGVSLVTMNRIENGRRQPDIVLLQNLAEFYGADLNWLVWGQQSTTQFAQGVPIVDMAAVEEEIRSKERISLPGGPACDYAIVVVDDTMMPVLRPGDFAFVKMEEPKVGEIALIRDANGIVRLRRRGQDDQGELYLAENPDFAPTRNSDQLRVIGKVVGSVRFQRC